MLTAQLPIPQQHSCGNHRHLQTMSKFPREGRVANRGYGAKGVETTKSPSWEPLAQGEAQFIPTVPEKLFTSPALHFQKCPSFEDRLCYLPNFCLPRHSSSFIYVVLGGKTASKTFLQENKKIVNHPCLSKQSHINVYNFSQEAVYPIDTLQCYANLKCLKKLKALKFTDHLLF